MKIAAILIGLMVLSGCSSDEDLDRSNKDPRNGVVYLYDTGWDQKVCDGNNLLYYTYGGAHNNESVAVVQNSQECSG